MFTYLCNVAKSSFMTKIEKKVWINNLTYLVCKQFSAIVPVMLIFDKNF